MMAIRPAIVAGRRTQSLNQIRNICLALHSYQADYGVLPPAFVADKDGKPMHSWRVLILPYLDEESLYKEYDFSEPWDGPNNSRLLARMPPIYRCPSHPESSARTNTSYAGVFGEHCVFRGADPVALDEITDGFGNTLIVGEVKSSIPWLKPEDVDIKLHPAIGPVGGFGSYEVEGAAFAFVDGRVLYISESTPQQTLDALYTRDGQDRVEDF